MKNMKKKLLIILIFSLIMIFNIISLQCITVFAAEEKAVIVDLSSGTLKNSDLTYEQGVGLDALTWWGVLNSSYIGNISPYKNESGKVLFYADWETGITTVVPCVTEEDNINHTISDADREIVIRYVGLDVFKDYEKFIIKFSDTHQWLTDWTKDDTAHWHECAGTECDVTENSEKSGYAEHSYGEWTITKVETEIETGIKERICTVCDYKETEVIPVHIHNLIKVDEIPATCTEDGHIEYYTCDGCEKWFEDEAGTIQITDKTTIKIAATEHDWNEWTVTKEATEVETGLKTRICRNDSSHKETEMIAKLAIEENINQTNIDKPGSPQTGDDSSIILWISLMFVSGLGIFITVQYMRKSNK